MEDKKLSYKEFRDMEEAHIEGNLIKICKGCGNPYKPERRIYYKKTWKLKEVPEIKILKNGKFKKSEFVRIKKVVGNWFLSRYCDNCIKLKKEVRNSSQA